MSATENKSTTIESRNQNLSVFNKLPDLADATPAPLELNSEYWTPAEVGEKKRLFFKELAQEQAVDMQTGENIEVIAIYFVERLSDDKCRVVRQCSKRLTGVFEPFVNAKTIIPGDAFEITYLGKKKNKNNAFMSDTWSVTPLAVN